MAQQSEWVGTYTQGHLDAGGHLRGTYKWSVDVLRKNRTWHIDTVRESQFARAMARKHVRHPIEKNRRPVYHGTSHTCAGYIRGSRPSRVKPATHVDACE